MGMIISWFRKKSAAEQLESIEEEIKELELCSADTKLRHQKITKQLLVYSSGLCIVFAIVLYFYIPPKLQTKIILITLLLLSPLIYYVVNKIISWYYKRKITSSHSRLKDLKKEKKRLIDEIMDKETYKVAKEILEKYAPEALPQKLPAFKNSPIVAMARPGLMSSNAPGGRPGGPPGDPPGAMMRSQTMAVQSLPGRPNINQRPPPNQPRPGQLALPPATVGQRMQPFGHNKGYVERFFEYLIGDGPNSRYALVCSQCSTHNGMALQEEFEYTAFKCYACFTLNPARKQRPVAPKLESDKSDRDTPEPDSCSSSVSEEQSNVRIEEIEDEDKDENDVEGQRKFLTKSDDGDDESHSREIELEERTSSSTFGVKVSGGSGANSEEDAAGRTGSEETFTVLKSSSSSDDIVEAQRNGINNDD